MSLENYLAKSRGPYVEILWDFSPEQKKQHHCRLKEIGLKQYRAFVLEHLQDILRYISLSPSQRQQKKWVSHPDGLLIRFAALQISGAVVALLDDIDEISLIVDNGSYRQFHSVLAGAVSKSILQPVVLKNPFDDFENPFL
jgi:hypothetical protein